MNVIRDLIAVYIGKLALFIAPDPQKQYRKKILKEIEVALDKLGWDAVVVPRKEYYKYRGLKDPLEGPNISGKRLPVRDLNDNDQIKKIMQDLGFENFYFEDAGYLDDGYYGESDISVMPNGFPPLRKPIGPSEVPQVNGGQLMKPAGPDIPPEMLDSVYNFAIVYVYGSKKNNIVTLYSVDKEERLFVLDQIQFNVRTYTDVIDVCNNLIEKHDLDNISIVNTEVGKKMLYFVKKGIENENVTIEITGESHNYNDDIQRLVSRLGIGEIFVSMGPWLEKFQMELNTHMMMPPQARSRDITKNFHRLKALVNGVKYWEEGVETNRFVRDFGLSEEVAKIVETEDGNK